jgi:hypothetical protein
LLFFTLNAMSLLGVSFAASLCLCHIPIPPATRTNNTHLRHRALTCRMPPARPPPPAGTSRERARARARGRGRERYRERPRACHGHGFLLWKRKPWQHADLSSSCRQRVGSREPFRPMRTAAVPAALLRARSPSNRVWTTLTFPAGT